MTLRVPSQSSLSAGGSLTRNARFYTGRRRIVYYLPKSGRKTHERLFVRENEASSLGNCQLPLCHQGTNFLIQTNAYCPRTGGACKLHKAHLLANLIHY